MAIYFLSGPLDLSGLIGKAVTSYAEGCRVDSRQKLHRFLLALHRLPRFLLALHLLHRLLPALHRLHRLLLPLHRLPDFFWQAASAAPTSTVPATAAPTSTGLAPAVAAYTRSICEGWRVTTGQLDYTDSDAIVCSRLWSIKTLSCSFGYLIKIIIIIILLKQDYKIQLADNKIQMARLTSWLVVR